jgi:hypothetical protein
MFGRSTTCLLLVLLFALAQSMEGQSDRVFSPDVAAPDVHLRVPSPLESRATAASQFPRIPVAPGSFGLPQFASAAGTIFSGSVIKIERHAASSVQPVEIVSISFHVERAIRGATAGEEITISQWIGLWSAGQRYRVGERVLLFLYPRSKLGLTSCVGGQMGRFTVDSWGRVLLSAQHLSVFRTDPVLGGKSRVPLSDFALAVRRAGGEE